MSQRDPIQALSNFYVSEPCPATDDQELLRGVYRTRIRRKQKLFGAVCGFTAGAAAATLLLFWAARPIQTGDSATMSAIARFQMINSGLAERHGTRMEITR